MKSIKLNREQQIYFCVERAFPNNLITNFAMHENTVLFAVRVCNRVEGKLISAPCIFSANIYFPALKEYSNGKIECNWVKPKRAVCYALGRLYKLLKRKGLLK